MKPSELAVWNYLRIAGAETIFGLYHGLERRYSLTEIRQALKAMGAKSRKFGDWPKYDLNGRPTPKERPSVGTHYVKPFVMFYRPGLEPRP